MLWIAERFWQPSTHRKNPSKSYKTILDSYFYAEAALLISHKVGQAVDIETIL